ncbi:cupin domain-containing protein [Streptomyces sp. ZAF1911]|uniref:cupin domain-containing protein n=1 Tax=Streptomyces sp. ZAF1911 TaxID=2944129 RepID=UPI00237A6E4D|nr:cupin domain-containing protein [Streptomyces sp. ZAF1911]MDD9375776.1 cupin domain-containing protein [Streptomyces sp. ZAF1911]
MRVLEDGSNTGHRLGLAECVLAPRTPRPPQHRHAQHDEGFYILSGTVRFAVGEEQCDATAGALVMVPPGQALSPRANIQAMSRYATEPVTDFAPRPHG